MNILEVETPDTLKVSWPTGDQELDSVFAKDGIKKSTITLIYGKGGTGKTSFCQQLADRLNGNKNAIVLYNGLEESPFQMKATAERLGLKNGFILGTSTTVEALITEGNKLQAANPEKTLFIFIDSLQALCNGSQKEQIQSLEQLHTWAKNSTVTLFIVSQVGKTGIYLGSGKIAHIVDMQIALTVDNLKRSHFYGMHILTVEKNRFGEAGNDRIYSLDGNGFRLIPKHSFQYQVAGAMDKVNKADSAMRKINTVLRIGRGLKNFFGK